MVNNSDILTLGVDLGGTKIKTALVDSKGQILSVDQHPTHPEKGVKAVIQDIRTCIDKCLDDIRLEEAKALGIGVAGQVDMNGVVQYAPNLRWQNIPLKSRLEDTLEIPVVVTNDVRAATWGEWRFGAGKQVNDMIVLFVGTGIGGGIISGGRLLQGCSNTSGELGHITIVADGRECHCPNRGCLEAYAGGWAIAERAREAIRDNPGRGELLRSLATNENISAYHVSLAFRQGDPLAKRLVDETCNYLSAGIVGIVNAFNPCLLVLGGGVIEGLPIFIEKVEQITRERALKAALEPLKFEKAALGGDAGVIGVAALAQKEIMSGPITK